MRDFFGPGADVRVVDMNTAEGAAKAARYGVTRVPAVVVDGRVSEKGRSEESRLEEGVGECDTSGAG